MPNATKPKVTQYAYTVDEACYALNLKRSMLYTKIANGEIESYKDGKNRRITPQACEKYTARTQREFALKTNPVADVKPARRSRKAAA